MQLYVSRDGSTLGPYNEAQVRFYLAQGVLQAHDAAVKAGQNTWKPLSEVLPFAEPAQEQIPPAASEPEQLPSENTPTAWGPWIVIAVLTVAICSPFIYQTLPKHGSQDYEEFIIEAEQLSSLTGYGVSRENFNAQLAKVKAHWNSLKPSDLPSRVDGTFSTAIQKWEEASRNWASDSEYRRGSVPRNLDEARQAFQTAKSKKSAQ
jgi:hypothetical protein